VNWLALDAPPLLSNVAADKASARAAPNWPAFVSVDPDDSVMSALVANVPLLNRVCTARAIRLWTAVTDPALAICPACKLTAPLPPIVPPAPLFSRPVVVRDTPSAFSDAT
jgi:hypothetical protein